MEKANNYSQIDGKICYIVGAGDPFLPFALKDGDTVIAADGGYDILRAHGMRADLVIGDFDSSQAAVQDLEGASLVERHPVHKDETDMALSLLRGYEMGYRRFVLLGGTGGREDHTYANYQLLLRARHMGADAVLVGRSQLVRVIENGACQLFGKVGETLSVFALNKEALGVTIEGAAYPLTDGTLTADFALGVSNAFATDRVRITVRDGALLVFSPLCDLNKIEFS